jgi:hypothetical protein
MPIDSRLRQGLERSASGATKDLVDDLPGVLARGRRRKRVIVTVRVATIAAVVAIVAVGGPRLVGSLRTDRPAGLTPSPSVAAADYSAIAGTYTVELTNADATVAANHMAGTWTVELDVDGAMQLSIPAGFTREGRSPTGNAFTLMGTQLRTNLFFSDFCHSVGVYGWVLRGTRLTFTPQSEDCPVRQAIFASPWNMRG